MNQELMLTEYARNLTDQIKVAVEGTWHLVRQAYEQRAWSALGYASWDDYCTREFGSARLRLPREERQEVVASLRESGLSFRAIAAATGVDDRTVRRASAAAFAAPADRIVGVDGKRYTSRPVPPLHPRITPVEAEAIVDTLQVAHDRHPTDDEVAEAVEACVESKVVPAITKPDLGGGVSHPARYSDALIPVFTELLEEHHHVLDPFAGTGRIHDLRDAGFDTVGVEIEPEWAALHPATILGDALALPFEDATFDAICTSPTYGNRLADHHEASDPHLRRSYTHDLGRRLNAANSGTMQWGEEYRAFHVDAWCEAVRVLRPGGRFVLNIKDHVRGGEYQLVAAFHVACLTSLGLHYDACLSRDVSTRALRQGENAGLRLAELVLVFDRGAA